MQKSREDRYLQHRQTSLTLVRNLVQKQLDGKITVHRDNGTEFVVEFRG